MTDPAKPDLPGAITIPIRNDVVLTPLQAAHAQRLLTWIMDPYVAQNIGLRATPGLEKTLAWIERTNTDASICARAILHGTQHVGNVILDHIDSLNQTARFSIYIGEAVARGTGVGKTAGYLICRHGFEVLGLRKIYLHVHIHNKAAIQSYRALGFVEEGTLRKEVYYQGVWTDALAMSLLREEFERFSPAVKTT